MIAREIYLKIILKSTNFYHNFAIYYEINTFVDQFVNDQLKRSESCHICNCISSTGTIYRVCKK